MIRRGRPPSAARHRPRGTRGLWLLLPVFFFRSPMSVWVFLHTWFMVYVAGTGRAASAGDHHHREENGPRGRSVPHNVGCGLLQQSSCHWGGCVLGRVAFRTSGQRLAAWRRRRPLRVSTRSCVEESVVYWYSI